MKQHKDITSSRRKCRKAALSAPSHLRRKLMSAPLSKDLRKKYSVRSMPIRKEDEVIILSGSHKGNKGKVTEVYRKKWCIHVEKLAKNKLNGQPVSLPIKTSQCAIIKLKLDRCRNILLTRKAQVASQKAKGDKYQADNLNQ